MLVYHSTVTGITFYLQALTSEFLTSSILWWRFISTAYDVIQNTRLMSYVCETEAHTRSKSVLALTQFLLQLGRWEYDSEPWTLRQSSVSCCYRALLDNIASFKVQLKIWSPVTVRSFQLRKALVHISYLNKKLMISCSRTTSKMKT